MRHLSQREIWLIRTVQSSRYGRNTVSVKVHTSYKPTHKLKAAYRARLAEVASSLMQRVEPTPFALEAPIRTWLRERLCLQGWSWRDADLAAEDVVDAALSKAGAERPTWKQGQPEFTQDGVVVAERFYCINCGSPLAEGQIKYCSSQCRSSFMQRVYRTFGKREQAAIQEMEDAA